MNIDEERAKFEMFKKLNQNTIAFIMYRFMFILIVIMCLYATIVDLMGVDAEIKKDGMILVMFFIAGIFCFYETNKAKKEALQIEQIVFENVNTYNFIKDYVTSSSKDFKKIDVDSIYFAITTIFYAQNIETLSNKAIDVMKLKEKIDMKEINMKSLDIMLALEKFKNVKE